MAARALCLRVAILLVEASVRYRLSRCRPEALAVHVVHPVSSDAANEARDTSSRYGKLPCARHGGVRKRGRRGHAGTKPGRVAVSRRFYGNLRGTENRAHPSWHVRQELRLLRLHLEHLARPDDAGNSVVRSRGPFPSSAALRCRGDSSSPGGQDKGMTFGQSDAP